ncbi:MAG: CehA/McbA family metallohydrolase [Verrucomicrobiota bacterium]
MRTLRLTSVLSALVIFSAPSSAVPEAFEVGPDNKDQLPRGKEADGIIGDFIVRNNLVEAVISANLPNRKANMSTFWSAIAPGCVFDLTLRGANNDQLTVFTPSMQQGPVSFVRIAQHGDDGEAILETVSTAPNNQGLFKRHQYRLRDDWQGLMIVTTVHNRSDKPATNVWTDRWTTFLSHGMARGISWADAVDPSHKAGYAFGWVPFDGAIVPNSLTNTLAPGQEISVARFLAVGRSPAEAFGAVAAMQGKTALISGSVTDSTGAGVTGARVEIRFEGTNVVAYPDGAGKFSVRLPPGSYEVEAGELGRAPVRQTISVEVDRMQTLDLRMEPAAAVVFDIRDDQGRSLPCKAQFIGVDGTPSPVLGPQNRAHGCMDQYHSERGQFRVQVPPGKYRIVVTRGIEFSHLSQSLAVEPGKTISVQGTLKRLVDTRGWISADYHNHSTPSGDNTCGTDDRLINLAAEQVEFAPTTEHNRFYDWRPHIEQLGLTNELNTIPGIELTGPGAHFNSFPFAPEPRRQDGGAPQWQKDPRLNAIVLRDFQGAMPDRWVQINHPDMVENFIDRDGDGHEDGGFWGLGQLIDAAETWGLGILAKEPFYVGKDREGKETFFYRREFIWLQMLNRGHRHWCVAVSDAHSVHGNGVGGWRMFVPSSTDHPGQIDWKEIVRNSKAGKIVISSGPFLEVQADDGTMPGGSTRASGSIRLRVRVQCTDWIDIDRVQVLVNGRQRPDLNFTRATHADWFQNGVVKFDREISVPLSQDAHLIVVAMGEKFDLKTGYGSSSQAALKPCAYHNPIFVDADGGGFTPNGDTLDWPLPTKRYKLEEVKKLLGHTP